MLDPNIRELMRQHDRLTVAMRVFYVTSGVMALGGAAIAVAALTFAWSVCT